MTVIERVTSEEYYRALGDNIRRLRTERKLSQLDLALEMGYEASVTVSYWETARSRPSAYIVARLEELFGARVRP